MSIIRDSLFGFGAILVFVSIPLFFVNWLHAVTTAAVGILIMAVLWKSYGRHKKDEREE